MKITTIIVRLVIPNIPLIATAVAALVPAYFGNCGGSTWWCKT